MPLSHCPLDFSVTCWGTRRAHTNTHTVDTHSGHTCVASWSNIDIHMPESNGNRCRRRLIVARVVAGDVQLVNKHTNTHTHKWVFGAHCTELKAALLCVLHKSSNCQRL